MRREVHFEAKAYKSHHVEKMLTGVGRGTCGSQTARLWQQPHLEFNMLANPTFACIGSRISFDMLKSMRKQNLKPPPTKRKR